MCAIRFAFARCAEYTCTFECHDERVEARVVEVNRNEQVQAALYISGLEAIERHESWNHGPSSLPYDDPHALTVHLAIVRVIACLYARGESNDDRATPQW